MYAPKTNANSKARASPEKLALVTLITNPEQGAQNYAAFFFPSTRLRYRPV